MENETIKKLKENTGNYWWVDSTKTLEIFSTKNATQNLNNLLSDESASNHLKFLAAELLFANGRNFPNPNQIHLLAKIYSNQLKETQIGNCWGVPGNEDGWSAKPLTNFLKLGKEAIPELKKLLSDDRVLEYIGSEEATVGNGFQIRVKDIAAFIIGKNIGFNFKVNPQYAKISPDEWNIRDKQIEEIKQKLGK